MVMPLFFLFSLLIISARVFSFGPASGGSVSKTIGRKWGISGG